MMERQEWRVAFAYTVTDGHSVTALRWELNPAQAQIIRIHAMGQGITKLSVTKRYSNKTRR